MWNSWNCRNLNGCRGLKMFCFDTWWQICICVRQKTTHETHPTRCEECHHFVLNYGGNGDISFTFSIILQQKRFGVEKKTARTFKAEVLKKSADRNFEIQPTYLSVCLWFWQMSVGHPVESEKKHQQPEMQSRRNHSPNASFLSKVLRLYDFSSLTELKVTFAWTITKILFF